MRSTLTLAINGQPRAIAGADAFATLSDYLRRGCRLTATKVVCAEGDCGACAVLVGRVENGRLVYRAIDSCIQFLYQLDGAHIVTAEGLGTSRKLHPVQRAMVEHFGSQCGYCTPGFVTTIAGLYETANGPRAAAPTEDELRRALSGNLCRCTGYVQIMESVAAIDPAACPRVGDLYPDATLLPALSEAATAPALVTDGERRVYLPTTIDDACAFKAANPGVIIVSGATDIGVQHNKGRIAPRTILCLQKIAALRAITIDGGTLRAGALATWAAIERAADPIVPDYAAILRRFGSPQIRNAGTIGGNLANASPIADSIPFLYVTESTLLLHGTKGPRRVPIEGFYLGYKKLDLAGDELVVAVETPLPAPTETLRLAKISRRLDMDISTFTAAAFVALDGQVVTRARIAYGGVGPVVLRLRGVEVFLLGKPLDDATLAEAGAIAADAITPISDVRGSAAYRRTLARNILARLLAPGDSVEVAAR